MKAIGLLITWPILALFIYVGLHFGLSQLVDLKSIYLNLSLKSCFAGSAVLCVMKLLFGK
jgi:hypothetical protein